MNAATGKYMVITESEVKKLLAETWADILMNKNDLVERILGGQNIPSLKGLTGEGLIEESESIVDMLIDANPDVNVFLMRSEDEDKTYILCIGSKKEITDLAENTAKNTDILVPPSDSHPYSKKQK